MIFRNVLRAPKEFRETTVYLLNDYVYDAEWHKIFIMKLLPMINAILIFIYFVAEFKAVRMFFVFLTVIFFM